MNTDKNIFEKNCVEHEKLERYIHKDLHVIFAENIGTEFDLLSNKWDLSRAGLKYHERGHT